VQSLAAVGSSDVAQSRGLDCTAQCVVEVSGYSDSGAIVHGSRRCQYSRQPDDGGSVAQNAERRWIGTSTSVAGE